MLARRRPTTTRRGAAGHWSALPLGFLIIVLAAWAFFVPLVGPYFGFGLATDSTWSFSQVHWTTSLAAGIAAFVGGLGLLVPARLGWGFSSFVALVGGAWLLISPSLYPVWGSGPIQATGGSDWMNAALWIGYFYGTGGLIVYLSGIAQALAWRRPARAARVDRPLDQPVVGQPVDDLPADERTVIRP